ncbi:MAG TPA: hypothetical protein VFS88_00710 [Micavibrio sp.]|nr:hypothetical protein [Micavibrio sp.]
MNSVLSNAPYTKAIVEQQSVVRSFAANPSRVQEASIQAPYLSLYIKVDTNFDKAVLQIRDNENGDVLRQIPTESQLEAYRRAQSSNAVRTATVEPETRVDNYEDTSDVETTSQTSSSTTSSAPTPAPDAPAPSAPQTVSVDTQA